MSTFPNGEAVNRDFQKGDTVYTQDGTNYYFDHRAGEHGYVSPIIIIQTTSYHGDDFDEHEEVADHMIPIPLAKLSRTPWVRKIHAETAAAVAEKKSALDELNSQIGAARTELRVTEQNMETMRKEIEGEARALERRFQWVRDFKRLIGEDPTFVLSTGPGIPHSCNPFDIELKSNRHDATQWHYQGKYDDGDEDIMIFADEHAMKAHVSSMFNGQPSMTTSDEIAWFKRWPHLNISAAAKAEMEAVAELERVRRFDRAKERLEAAQAEMDRYAPPLT